MRSFRRYMSKTKGADKLAVAFWMAVDFAWCQEQGEAAVGAAAVMLVCCLYTLSVAQSSPHEVLHCCSVLLWASGNISWMWMELGQARLRRDSEYRGVGAESNDFALLRAASLVFFSLAFAVEVTYFTYLRHTEYFEGTWKLAKRRDDRPRSPESGSAVGGIVEGGGSEYGATDGGALPLKAQDNMRAVHPRCPAFFKTWNDYESIAIMIWIGKDMSWMLSTKFRQHIDAARWSWLTFTCLVFAIHIDFVLVSMNTDDTVEWVNYFAMLLWACSQTLWAGGEIFLHESVVKREPVMEKPTSYDNLRWYAGWFALLSVTVLYSFWFGKTLGGLSADWEEAMNEESEADGDGDEDEDEDD